MNENCVRTKNIVLIGMPGVGKTTVGTYLAAKIGRTFVDADNYLEQKHQQTIPEMFAVSETYFRDLEQEVIKELAAQTGLVIATGGGVIKRPENIEALRQNSQIFFLDKTTENILRQVQSDHRPLLQGDRKIKLEALYNERQALYLSSCDYRIDCNQKTLASIAKQILNVLTAPEQNK